MNNEILLNELDFNTKLGPECDVAISTRIRFARNLSGLPFPSRLDENGRRSVTEQIKNIISSFPVPDKYKYIDADTKTSVELKAVMENRIVSPDFINAGKGKELIYNSEKNLYIMVNEEDHLRIQCIMPGLSLDGAFDNILEFDELLNENAEIAFHEKFGFLTQCPTNLGTGMRASVMLHLPALRITNSIKQLIIDLSKLGLTIRGLYGENTEANGDLYQVSNQVTLGVDEKEIIEKMKSVISKIIALERKARDEIKKNSENYIYDKIMRSYGIFTNAYMIKIEEFLNLYSYIRLGITYSLIKTIDYKFLDKLLTGLMMANLKLKYQINDNADVTATDILRAKTIKENLKI